MGLRLSKKDTVLICMFFLLSIISICFWIDTPNNVNQVGMFCVLHIIVLLIILLIRAKSFLSFEFVFIFFCLIFFYGQTIVQLVNVNVFEGINVYAINSSNTIIQALLFTSKSIHFIVLGILLCPKKKKKHISKNLNDLNTISLVYKTGLSLFIIGAIPKFIIDISRVYLYSIYHYNLVAINIGGGYISTISNFAEYGLILMVISGYKSDKFSRNIVIISILYQLIPILCGVRARSIVFIVTILFCYSKMYRTIDVKKLLFYGLAGYCSLILLNIVSQTRQTGITFEIIIEAFKLNSSSSPIFTALEEFGNTLGSLCYTIYSNPKSAIMNYGVFNPIIRCLNAIPNLGGFLDSFQNIFYVNTNFIKSLPFSNSLGGSFLCELYFDFGEIGFMFSIFIGIMVGCVQQITFDSLENRQLVKMMYILPLFSNMLWWIRDNFIVIPREFLWNAILVYIISSIIKKRRIHRG